MENGKVRCVEKDEIVSEPKFIPFDVDDPIGAMYSGQVNVTEYGIPCQKWNINYPHKSNVGHLLSENHNYCRNPDVEEKPWVRGLFITFRRKSHFSVILLIPLYVGNFALTTRVSAAKSKNNFFF